MPRKHARPIFLDSFVRGGKFVQVYRNRDTGRLASAKQYQAQFKRKKRKPKRKFMWRCTLTVALIYSGQRDHKYKHVRVTAWAKYKRDAVQLARDQLDDFASDYCKTGLWEDFNFPSEACEQIEFDKKLVDSAVVVDETKHD